MPLGALPRVGDVLLWYQGWGTKWYPQCGKVLSVSLDKGGVMMQAFDDAGESMLEDEEGDLVEPFYISLQALMAGSAGILSSGKISPVPAEKPAASSGPPAEAEARATSSDAPPPLCPANAPSPSSRRTRQDAHRLRSEASAAHVELIFAKPICASRYRASCPGRNGPVAL
jgi:hypothetical protein